MPSPHQPLPGLLTEHEERISALERRERWLHYGALFVFVALGVLATVGIIAFGCGIVEQRAIELSPEPGGQR
jgi:hypothetical protein